MLELSENILRQGYTITITKERNTDKIQGLYTKKMSEGLHAYELPQEELKVISHLPNIGELLSDGEMLQASMPGLSFQTTIGSEKTEGPHCETKYLEVHGEAQSFGYCDCLISLNEQLGAKRWQQDTKAPQYKKLYRGENKYE